MQARAKHTVYLSSFKSKMFIQILSNENKHELATLLGERGCGRGACGLGTRTSPETFITAAHCKHFKYGSSSCYSFGWSVPFLQDTVTHGVVCVWVSHSWDISQENGHAPASASSWFSWLLWHLRDTSLYFFSRSLYIFRCPARLGSDPSRQVLEKCPPLDHQSCIAYHLLVFF